MLLLVKQPTSVFHPHLAYAVAYLLSLIRQKVSNATIFACWSLDLFLLNFESVSGNASPMPRLVRDARVCAMVAYVLVGHLASSDLLADEVCSRVCGLVVCLRFSLPC
ncbi:hypothetical protein TRVL_06529 [Trypanosoma vivax]|uniref:Uncharacterized protein n=1 Tax=Trypanosoma vivax (strain Y486) TaxID=1055687 RepID=G0U9K6_TRYVY|nr:hypothetical protein TRVL_06529 [Trypanosoma vivax]CCC54292.1 hypothetical protein TVY486_1117760 [Trypanosoma vivax Y486]